MLVQFRHFCTLEFQLHAYCLKNQVVVVSVCLCSSMSILSHCFYILIYRFVFSTSLFSVRIEKTSFISVSLVQEQHSLTYHFSYCRCILKVYCTKGQCLVNTQILQASLFGVPVFLKGLCSSSTKYTQILNHSLFHSFYFGTSVSFCILNPNFNAPNLRELYCVRRNVF